jgi:hypothetical protein
MCCDIFPALLRDPLGWTKWRSTSEGGSAAFGWPLAARAADDDS